MAAEGSLNLKGLAGYRWLENGQSILSGELLELYRRLDRLFLKWAGEERAKEYAFPPFIPARELDKLDYFRSFPHLVTFPAALDPDAKNLERFADGTPVDAEGSLHPSALGPIRDILTPAACYPFYIHFQGEALQGPRVVTTRATCFRREESYVPLERQWSFSMREIVCLGTAEEVKEFLKRSRDRIDRFLTSIRLPIEWREAADPFFRPTRNPKYLLQKLDPVKTEMVFQDRLAIGSLNFHRNYFGETFRISRGGEEAFSGCVAFGLERWIAAFLDRFGTHKESWPLREESRA